MINMLSKYDRVVVDETLLNALREDVGHGDLTTASLIQEDDVVEMVLIAKENIVLAGLPFFQRIFSLTDDGIKFKVLKREGSRVKSGNIVARMRGKTKSLLVAERTALNLMQRMSGIATLTREYVNTVKGLKAKIVDTRKTAPGLRYFDKYAVVAGGGYNHRFGLYDGVLIKDNHIAAVGGVGKAVRTARANIGHLVKVEVEVRNLVEVREAVSAGADVIMLDNMTIDKMSKSVELVRSKSAEILIEASGNLSLDNVRSVAETGVDMLSVGALTHSAAAADLSLKVASA